MEGGRRLEERLKGKEGGDESNGGSGITKGWRGKEEGRGEEVERRERDEIEGKEGKRRKRKEIWPTEDVHKIHGEGRKLVSRERNIFSVQTNNSHKP